MSFFCLDAGRISSRSTGTPNETRKRRRVRDRIQSGGASGGGATSCDQREAERSVENTEGVLESAGGKSGNVRSSGGKRLARKGSVVDMMSSGLRPSKSGIGWRVPSTHVRPTMTTVNLRMATGPLVMPQA